MSKINIVITLLVVTFSISCGSYKVKYLNKEQDAIVSQNTNRKLEKTFYLIGDAGGAKEGTTTEALKAFENFIQNKDTKEDYLVYLGDNIYEKGMPSKDDKKRKDAEHKINVQIEAAKKFQGTSVFIPGNHDWYNKGLQGLKRQEEYVEDAMDDNEVFQPENGCPIETISISDEIELLIIDTQWYLADWDKHPTINDECDIKNRAEFFNEIEGELKKNNEKTILITMHHPAFTYGLHGGYYNFNKHIFSSSNKVPLPIIASLVTQVRSQGGVSPQDRYNNRYNELMKRLITLATDSDRVIFASGHEHTLQYIENEGIKQIVSGSGAKEAPVNLGKGARFAYGKQGFAVLDVYEDGGSVVQFYGAVDGKAHLLYTKQVHPPRPVFNVNQLPETFPQTVEIAVYPKEMTQVSTTYKWLWGEHYRDLYSTPITAKVATLDTLYGGLTVIRKGGGHQTRSLRLNDKNGNNYNLRALSKSAVQFLQSTAFKDNFIEDDFKETLTEDLILDFYTASHPYAPFIISGLADAIEVYHTNPQLLYIPKHKALGKYNDEYGDELYMLVERPDEGFTNVASFGTPKTIESTSTIFENLRKDEKYKIDEASYIKERLFDMLLGDWDRHQDQWRWAQFDINGEKVYKPIPRDRDQVFSNYDGALLDLAKTFIPPTRQFQEYNGKLKHSKWINAAGIGLDRTFTQTSNRDVWLQQAHYIKENLTDAAIEKAFKKLPKELDSKISQSIILKLKERRDLIVDIANEYYDVLSKLVILTGTDKDDAIIVERKDNATLISISRIKDGEVMPPFKQRYITSNETKEVWLYALDDDDDISVIGNGNNPVFTRIIGGQNNDIYTIKSGKRIKVYDYKSKPNTVVDKGNASFKFSDIYDFNRYYYNKKKTATTTILPSIGFNPDDGFRSGLQLSYVEKGFKSDPFQVKHRVGGGYFFATQGFDFQYEGEFANTFGSWNLFINARATSENFTQNFFGFGNESQNFDADLGFDFNRVKTSIIKGGVGISKDGHYGSRMALTLNAERVEVDETSNRFIDVLPNNDPTFFESKYFGNLNFDYSYSGFDNKVSPTRGMFFQLRTGVTTNLEATSRTFGYIHPSLEFYNALSRNRKLVLRTQVQSRVTIGDTFEFYQAAILGANSGLRGFRTQRFTGESALAFSGDLQYALVKFRTGLVPLKLGVYGGGDYGRVWFDGEDSTTWHNSLGGGMTLNAVDAISGNLGFFNSVDGLRFSFGFTVGL